jgi:protein FRG1
MRNTYLSIDADATPPVIRGDADEITPATELRLRMQARFKPKNKDEKAEKVRAKISRKELEEQAGRPLNDDEVKMLKKARRDGNFHEAMLDVKVKGSHDKYS